MAVIGRRRDLWTLQRNTATSDGQGGATLAWTTYGTAWCGPVQMNAAESMRAQMVTSELSTVLVTDFRTDVSVKDRMVLGARTVQIENYQDRAGDRRDLHLTVTEVQA